MNTDVLALYNHNPDLVLGRTSANTLEVAEDAKGLRFSVRLPNTSYANDLVSLMERGDIAACSFAFVCVADSWANENGILIRTLEEVELIEGSIVGQPAYPNTVADLRSCPAQLRSMLPAKDKTKEVDGVELPASCFAYVGDPAETDTWKLPIHFPDDIEKTKSHIRNALARFNQTEGIPEDKRAEVYARIVGAAKAHGISVSKESLHEGTGSRSLEDSLRIKLWTASRQRNL